jgi:hypothetical protein
MSTTLPVPLFELMRLAINANQNLYGQWSMGAFRSMVENLERCSSELRLVQIDGKNYDAAVEWATDQFGKHLNGWYVISPGLFLFCRDTLATAFKVRWA